MTVSHPDPPGGHPAPEPRRFSAQRIPPTHDFISSHGASSKGADARGPADPEGSLDPGKPPGPGESAGAAALPVGAVHKFGYTRPPKVHERQEAAATPVTSPMTGPTPFVHLHVHSNFSFLDGGSRIEELVARAAELGQPALALTDHDGLYGAVRFAKACAKRGVKPIFGAEVRVESLLAGEAAGPTVAAAAGTDGSRAARRGRAAAGGAAGSAPAAGDPHHLVLLAETREGYANLCRLLTAAHLADPERERPPLVTLDSLHTHSEGLICLTGCRHGQIGALIDAGRDNDARTALLRLRETFTPDHLYVELQYFGYQPHQEAHAGQHGVPVYQKARAEGNRLRHRPAPAAPQTSHSDHVGAEIHHPVMHPSCAATLVASWRTAERPLAPDTSLLPPHAAHSQPRFDLPQGHPQRLNPADYDVGFHRDGRPWRLSCLTYCERLTRLAAACGLATVLTTNAHYAGENDRALHLICRAAGRDQPLSGYPDPVPGARCLKSKAELEALAAPLLELIETESSSSPGTAPGPVMQNYCTALDIADSPGEMVGHEGYMGAIGTPGPVMMGVDPAFMMQNDCDAMFVASQESASPLATTWDIAQRCNVDLDLGTFHFPLVDVPPGETAYSLLAKRCFRGIARCYRPVPPRAVELLEKELRMIQQMGFAHYFLVVHDIVRWARARGIACSGRGSAGNSVVCHALDITASEPIRHNLLFERFLNPNRREMPDIDVDFCSSRRDEVIEHIYKTFGDENVAVVANVNTMSPRSAVRIVAEALGFAPTEINALAANVPHHGDAARIREYLAGGWPELRDSPLQDGARPVPAVPPGPDGKGAGAGAGAAPAGGAAPQAGGPGAPGTPAQPGAPAQPEGRYARFLDFVERLDSFPMHLGTHLGGFVIADRPITYYAPLQWAAKRVAVRDSPQPGSDRRDGAKDAGSARSQSATGATEDVGSVRPAETRRPGRPSQAPATKGVVVIQFNKDDVAALGLVKMDILGLRTHSAVSECVHLIRQRTGRRVRPYDLAPDDPAAYEIISNGGSIGLFQLESAGQRNLASRLQERDFDDVIAAIALYRPGPLEAEMIGPFIDRRWGLEPVSLPHPAMADAVADTYGVILYQEQVLRIAQSVAGFDLADADSLRRAMTRDRSREEMAKIGETFIARAVERGVPEGAAREVFRQLEGFAAYGFNKSHSVCFAVISYATAWLKAYYPAEFLCSVLNNYPMGFYTPRVVLNDARRFGLEVRPLDINLSGRGVTVEDAEPPDVWGTAGAAGDGAATHASGARTDGAAMHIPEVLTPYDPFAQAWTAEHSWGLTAADLAELEQEQNGEAAYAEALRVAMEQLHGPDKHHGESAGSRSVPVSGGNPSFVRTLCAHSEGAADNGAVIAAPASVEQTRSAHPLGPRDLVLPRAPRARGGVEPGACLAPSSGTASDAGQALRVGFSFLKRMGERSLERIEAERRHGPFLSFEDFYLRTRIDYPVAENLIRVGAFDSLEPDRTELLWRLPLLHDRLEALSGSSGQRRGQLRAFFSPPSRAGLERQWSQEDKVRAELELLGLTVSCHPLTLYEEELRRMGVHMSYELPAMGDEVPVTVAGVYERAQNPWMRSGKRTMFLTLEDAYGLYECVCFESKLPKIAPVVARASYFLVRGRLQNNHKRGLAIVAEEVLDLEEVLARRKAGKRCAPATGRAKGTADAPAGRKARITQTLGSPNREMPPIPDSVALRSRREEETYGNQGEAQCRPRVRAPGAGTMAIPKKVG